MVTFKKFKYIIFSLLAIAVIASATAFSVSYAKWVSPANDSLGANLSTGVWDNPPSTDYTCQFDYGYIIIKSNGAVEHVELEKVKTGSVNKTNNYIIVDYLDEENDIIDGNYILFHIEIAESSNIKIFLGDRNNEIKYSTKGGSVTVDKETGNYVLKSGGTYSGYISMTDGVIAFN